MAAGWLWLVPTTSAQASYSPVVFLLVIAACGRLTFLVVRASITGGCAAPIRGTAVSRADRAHGGHGGRFGQPIRQIFAPRFLIHREIPRPDDPHPVFRQEVEDRHWYWIYRPVADLTELLFAPDRQTSAGAHLGVPSCTASSRSSPCWCSRNEQRRRDRFPGASSRCWWS
jgi:hypothetical protein